MLMQTPVVEHTSGLSIKLQQLRRLRSQSTAQPASMHLNSALQTTKRERAGAKPEVSYIFIGIEIPTTLPASA